jgi:hypothetical protein
LDQVYTTTQGRSKFPGCRECIVEEICAGYPAAWAEAGHHVAPVDENRYAAAFPIQLLNQTLFLAFHDAVKARTVLATFTIDWQRLAVSFAGRLAGDEIRSARRRISTLSAAERCDALIQYLENSNQSDFVRLAKSLSEAMRGPVTYA